MEMVATYYNKKPYSSLLSDSSGPSAIGYNIRDATGLRSKNPDKPP
jgi:hypothetical protein